MRLELCFGDGAGYVLFLLQPSRDFIRQFLWTVLSDKMLRARYTSMRCVLALHMEGLVPVFWDRRIAYVRTDDVDVDRRRQPFHAMESANGANTFAVVVYVL